jgi:hypothetical protein
MKHPTRRTRAGFAGGSLRAALGIMMIVGLVVWAGGTAKAGPGHNHGDEQALPAVALEDLRPRAMGLGTWFEFVGMPVSGALAIFLDNADTNEPVVGARVELLTVADEPLIAEEVIPGIYLASPWPPAGVSAEALRGSDIVATVIADNAEDLLIIPLSDAVVDATLKNGETAAGEAHAALTGKLTTLARAEDGNGLWLVLVGGLISLAGVSAGVRFSGLGRWVGVSAIAVGLAISMSTTGLV